MEPDTSPAIPPPRLTKDDEAALVLGLNMALEHCGPSTKKGIMALVQIPMNKIAAIVG